MTGVKVGPLTKGDLERDVAAIAARFPRVYATDGPLMCHGSAGGYHSMLMRKGYDCQKIYEWVPLLDPIDIDGAYTHSSVRVVLEEESFVVDGTYRQFFHGGKGDSGRNTRREVLPKYFFGTIVEMYHLFRENTDLLNGGIIRRMRVNGRIEGDVEEHHIAKLVSELYGVRITEVCPDAAKKYGQERRALT
jgi:hypothetical protein